MYLVINCDRVCRQRLCCVTSLKILGVGIVTDLTSFNITILILIMVINLDSVCRQRFGCVTRLEVLVMVIIVVTMIIITIIILM